MSKGDAAFYVVVAVVLIIASIFYFQQKSDCDARGGVMVRGAFGFECAAGPGAK